MAISASICVVLPIFIFLFWRKKYNLKAVPMLLGIAMWILFAYILQSLLHGIALEQNEDGTIKLLAENPWLFAVYAILAAGIFEETGRFAAFKLIRKRHNDLGTGLSYGIGHGGVEAIFLTGLSMIGFFTTCLMINSGNTEAFVDDENFLSAIVLMQETPSVTFLLGGIERLISITVHISLSMVVLCSVVKQDMLWLYPAAIALHAAVKTVPALFQIGVIESIWVMEALLLIPTALCVYAAVKVCKIMSDQDAVLYDKQAAKSVSEPTGPTL